MESAEKAPQHQETTFSSKSIHQQEQSSKDKNKKSQQRSGINDYKEESMHQSDIKEVIVDKIDKHQKVLDLTLGDIRVINLVTTDKVQFHKHVDVNNIDHLMSDNIASEFRSIDVMIESMQDSFIQQSATSRQRIT